MAYTALREMQQINESRFGEGVGPIQPALHAAEEKNDLKSAALRFLHETCEGLRFDPQAAAAEKADGQYRGTGAGPGQVPWNMEKDIERLCLERELEKFIDSGVAEDAYTVYYCYLSMFFGSYGHSKKMVELLSEFESNGSSLLMKHRDHYSHSVYVFALGLAIYETNENYRQAFRVFYEDEIREKAEMIAEQAAGGAADTVASDTAGRGSVTIATGTDATDDMAAGDADVPSAAAPSLTPEDRAAAYLFLEYWGLTSLFHDIGYPFELPFEQVQSYFEVADKKRGKGRLFLSYRNLDKTMTMEEDEVDHFEALYGRRFKTTNGLLAHAIIENLGAQYRIDEEELCRKIASKPVAPEEFGYYMDHAWFSAVRLYREIINAFGIDAINRIHIDALSAILMHNSLYKFVIDDYKSDDSKGPLPMDLHPLAYLLMLCDELQCWDRIAYGRNSRTELHPMAADFDFSGNAIRAVYFYDEEEDEKIEDFRKSYKEWEDGGKAGDAPRLKAYSDMAGKEQRFTADIRRIVDTTLCPLTVRPDTDEVDRSSKHTYLSDSSFLHLYDFAVALNARYSHEGTEEETTEEMMEAEYESLSLEYQLSNINQAKSFARYLDRMDCFYTDRPVDYDMIREFTPYMAEVIAPMEHERWVREHIDMGWIYGDIYETVQLPRREHAPESLGEKVRSFFASMFGTGDAKAGQPLQEKDEERARKALREQLRTHKLAMDGAPSAVEIWEHYQQLPLKEQAKDWKPFDSMLKLIRKYDGLRIYRLR